MVDKKLLMEDIKFPLQWDSDSYKMYIFDANMEMVAQVDMDIDATKVKHPFEKLIGDYKEPEINYVQYRLYKGDFYDVFDPDNPIGSVRGWGRLTSGLFNKGVKDWEEIAVKKQDNIAQYILNVINS